ncbi:MAG TPA: M48 family metalloprotease [Haliangiales bacterium]|nr:M48 family metalloprotease [Haliangiales bacterium]
MLAALGLFGCQAVKNVAAGKGTSEDLQQIGDVAQKGAKIAKAVTNLGESLTAEQEYWVGRSIATNLLAKSDYKYENKADIAAGKLVGITAYANNVGALIAFAATETHRDGDRPAPIFGWHFVVVDSDTVNGFAAPGGFVFVTTAALKLAKNEDELAGILAHEVAHVVRGHALGNIQKSRYAGLTQDVLEAAGSATLTPAQKAQLTDLMGGMIQDTIDAVFVKGYSRDTELEADRLAVQIAATAGYDPAGIVRFLEALHKVQNTGQGGFFATHPKAEDRIAALKDVVASLPAVKAPKTRTDRFATAISKIK